MSKINLSNNAQIIYLSHGGGPLPVLGDASHEKMINFMKGLQKTLRKPDAIIVFSAHWEEKVVAVQSGDTPSMMYDYYGFPPKAYEIKYPCIGDANLAARVAGLFEDAGIKCNLDSRRPYDHGSYIPLMMMYPDADIPVIQVSLHRGLEPLVHLNMGKALRPLLERNLLIIGSGFSFHNMTAFDFSGEETIDSRNDEFQDKLSVICCSSGDDALKSEKFEQWEKIPHARYCHPREEHLLPLMVCAGMATSIGSKVFDDYILGKRATAYLF